MMRVPFVLCWNKIPIEKSVNNNQKERKKLMSIQIKSVERPQLGVRGGGVKLS
jgi:hypothetical protein